MSDSRFPGKSTPPSLFTLVTCSGYAALSLNVILPALPAMAITFDTNYATMQWAVSAYVATAAILQLFVGPLSDLYGRRPVMIASLLIVLTGTLTCMFAPNLTVFMFGRLLQTCAVAGLVLPRAIVRDTVPLHRAAAMIAYITMGMSLVPMIAPGVGGYLSDIFGWRSIFILMLAIGLMLLALVLADLGETNRTRAASITAQFKSWPELFRSKVFWGYCLAATFMNGGFFSYLGAAPFIGSEIFGLSPSELGLRFFMLAAGYMVGNFIAACLSQKLGPIRMITIGGLVNLTSVSSAAILFTLYPLSSMAFFGPVTLIGMANGIALPNANAGVVGVSPALAGSASGLAGFMSMGFGATMSAIAASLLSVATGIWPVLYMIGLCGLCALASTFFVSRVLKSGGTL